MSNLKMKILLTNIAAAAVATITEAAVLTIAHK
jgi:hypothetical protein